MNFALLAGFAAASLYTVYLAILVNAASPQVVAFYIVASVAALAVSHFAKDWAGRVKWVWVALSLVVIYAVVSGPLNFLRVS